MATKGPGPRRFLFISNGHGEDSIAAAIAERMPRVCQIEAYPMIGAGNAYTGICPVVGPRATLASEGWRNVKGSLRRDLVSGGLGTISPALRFLRNIHGKYDRVVVIGDMVGVLACLATGNKGIIYIDVYKTGAARLYSRLERWAIERTCTLAFCRARTLAQALPAIDARYAGNVMVDTIPFGDYDVQSRRIRKLAITLLPGSRQLTIESFALQIQALRLVPQSLYPDVFLAVAGSIKVDELARATGLTRSPVLSIEPDDLGILSNNDLTIHMARGSAMGNLLLSSDVVLSQAGTATVQALGMGKPVLTFTNPRDRRSRFNDEQNLFGDARTVVAGKNTVLGEALTDLLSDSDKRQRLGALGQERIGPPGAMQAILQALTAS